MFQQKMNDESRTLSIKFEPAYVSKTIEDYEEYKTVQTKFSISMYYNPRTVMQKRRKFDNFVTKSRKTYKL